MTDTVAPCGAGVNDITALRPAGIKITSLSAPFLSEHSAEYSWARPWTELRVANTRKLCFIIAGV